MTLIVSFTLFHYACGSLSLKYINPISFALYVELTICYIGLLSLILYPGCATGASRLASTNSLTLSFWVFSYSLISLPFTMGSVNKFVFKYKPRLALLNMYSGSQNTKDNKYVPFWVLLSFVMTFCVIYFHIKYPSPWFSVLTGSSFSPAIVRGQISARNMPYIDNLLNRFLLHEISFLIVPFLIFFCRKKETGILLKGWTYIYIIVAFLAVLHSGGKAPIIFFIFSLFVAFSILKKGSIEIKKLFQVVLVLLVMLVYIFSVAMPVSFVNPSKLFQNIQYRILIGQVEGFPLSLDLFPINGEFLGANGLPTWIIPFIGIQERLEPSRLRALHFFRYDRFSLVAVGVMNTIFLGDAWAYFGFIGMILSPIYVGIVFSVLYWIILKKTPGRWQYALFIYFLSKIKLTGGIMPIIWNPLWGILFAVAIGEIVFTKLISGVSTRQHEHPIRDL